MYANSTVNVNIHMYVYLVRILNSMYTLRHRQFNIRRVVNK